MAKPRVPAGLGAAGKRLWSRLVDEFVFGPHELAILEAAAHQADDVAALEALIASEGLVVAGSQGQPRLAAAVTEVRQGRMALARLLGDLALPDEEERPMTTRQTRAKHAADARWSRVRALRGTA